MRACCKILLVIYVRYICTRSEPIYNRGVFVSNILPGCGDVGGSLLFHSSLIFNCAETIVGIFVMAPREAGGIGTRSFRAGKKLIRIGVNNGVLELGIGEEVYFDAQNEPWI
jgi:hypothetical protein